MPINANSNYFQRANQLNFSTTSSSVTESNDPSASGVPAALQPRRNVKAPASTYQAQAPVTGSPSPTGTGGDVTNTGTTTFTGDPTNTNPKTDDIDNPSVSPTTSSESHEMTLDEFKRKYKDKGFSDEELEDFYNASTFGENGLDTRRAGYAENLMDTYSRMHGVNMELTLSTIGNDDATEDEIWQDYRTVDSEIEKYRQGLKEFFQNEGWDDATRFREIPNNVDDCNDYIERLRDYVNSNMDNGGDILKTRFELSGIWDSLDGFKDLLQTRKDLNDRLPDDY